MTKKERETQMLVRTVTTVTVTAFIVAVIAGISVTRGHKRQREQTGETKSIIEVESEETMQQEETDKYAVFDTMSRDWGDEIDGFVYYEIPAEYEENGGYFPEIMQIYTYCICKQEDVSYPLIVAMIEHESGYKFDEAGDGGESLGYMQISEKWHKDRMKELECNNLLNPYQNVRVGISLMKDLIEKYGTIQDALTVYNYGETGARRYLWSNGIYVYDYNKSIMSRMNEIEEELQQQG